MQVWCYEYFHVLAPIRGVPLVFPTARRWANTHGWVYDTTKEVIIMLKDFDLRQVIDFFMLLIYFLVTHTETIRRDNSTLAS